MDREKDALKTRRANLAHNYLKELVISQAPKLTGDNRAAWSKMVVATAFCLADEFILQSEDL